ncbi:Re/Si-specific NAD(P)(+) transhydrogenase subunit alpha [Vibrio sp.]|nr:Re/Si-specific NAD(P)(+) transhydrogenase subunit alpha [Vibrio sp.]
MQIGIPKETVFGEARVAASPKSVEQLIQLGFTVLIEDSAGVLANFTDQAFDSAGAKVTTKEEVWSSNIVLKVNAPSLDEIELITDGATLISFIWPAQNPELLEALTSKNINVLAMDAVPRISRAQSLDALSSMANIAGYRAIVEAAHEFGRFFSGQITAAGKIPPATILIAGAGVAGLAAIGAAGSLGAIVRAVDVRPEVKEQVESMGAEFLTIDPLNTTESSDGYAKETSEDFNRKAAELYAAQAKDVDVIVTTALIPGKPAPKLITKEMVDSMKAGSVIVDLAAANGGNCEYTEKDTVITTPNGVKVIGYSDMVSRLPTQSSQLYATNLVNLLKLLCKNKDGNIHINFNDVVLRGVTVIKEGVLTWPAPPIEVSAQPKIVQSKVQPSKPTINQDVTEEKISPIKKIGILTTGVAAFAWIASVAPTSFLSSLTVFVLACVVGYYVVWNVTHALHTPLMSVTNAISGIIIVGALLQIGQGDGIVSFLAFIAVLIASINIFGGFTVTKRMLDMFRQDK